MEIPHRDALSILVSSWANWALAVFAGLTLRVLISFVEQTVCPHVGVGLEGLFGL
jgi:hypothetical protein